MYAPFFGLSKEPFSIAPDPRFLYMSEQHREALAHLLYGLSGGGGFVLLTGEIGAGKTTVCRCFLEQLPAHCAVAYVFNPKLTAIELLQTVCAEFGIAAPADASSVKAHVDALNAFLLAAHAEGRQAVLVIDEAQSLSADVLEQLRLLTNLETAERKLLQIVLIGQPELREMLARPELEQLAQRVIARYHLGPLSAAQTEQYIRHRLAVAGPRAPLLFDRAALARIHSLSRGVPRRINLLADRALLGAYAQGQQQADRRTVEKASREVFGSRAPSPLQGRWAWAAGGLLMLAAAGGAGLTWRAQTSSPPTPALATVAATLDEAPASAAIAAPAVSAPSAPASVIVAPAAPASAPQANLGAVLAAAQPSQAQAWRELALRWNVAIGEGDPCVAAAQAQLACFRSASGGLPVVHLLARPGWLTLRAPGGGEVHALLVAIDESEVTLQSGAQRFVISLARLATVWDGNFATFWRTPEGWRAGGSLADPPFRAWLDEQLARAGVSGNEPQAQKVRIFQRAQGLPPDGVAGPMTLMRLARVAGVDEPRLAAPR